MNSNELSELINYLINTQSQLVTNLFRPKLTFSNSSGDNTSTTSLGSSTVVDSSAFEASFVISATDDSSALA